MKLFLMAGLINLLVLAPLYAAEPAVTNDSKAEAVLVTVILRHDQSKTLDEINAHLEKTGFWKEFPPAGIEIVSWHVVMGIGHVVTLAVPPSRLREVNLAVEKNAWGAFRSEFYPTYDFRSIYEGNRKKAGG